MKAEKIKPTLHVNGNIIAERMELDPTNGGGHNMLCINAMRRFIGSNSHRGRLACAFARGFRAGNYLLRGICMLVALAVGGGFAMGVSNDIITAGVQLKADVTRILGESNASVGYLCSNRHGKTNMWSRRKPVHIANEAFPNRNGSWWRGTMNDCGIIVRQVRTYDYIKDETTADLLNGWEYMPPAGGSGSPYRIADFIGYYHAARGVVYGWHIPEVVVEGGTLPATLMYVNLDDENRPELTLKDLNAGGIPLSDWALGIRIYDNRGVGRGRVVGESVGSCTFDTRYLVANQTYTVYPFLALHPMGQFEEDIVNEYVTLPFCEARKFKVVSQDEYYGFNISIFGDDDGAGIVKYRIVISIEKTSVRILGGGLQLRFSDSDPNDELIIGESTKTIDEYYIEAGKSLELTGTFFATGGVEEHPGYRLDLILQTNAFGTVKRSADVRYIG